MDYLADNPAMASAFVFLARVLDVSLGTLRTILVFRAFRVRSALIGFAESLIWVTAAGLVLSNLSAWHVAIAYAGGYGAGNYVGIWLESKLAMGMELVRIISADAKIELASRLREEGFSVVELDGHDDRGRPVEVLLVVAERRSLSRLLRRVEEADPAAIYTISDVKRHRADVVRNLRTRRMFPLRK